MKIKFNHIQDLGDARYAAAVMAEWIGFAIDGPYAIPPEKIQEIIGWCSGPKIIIEIYGEPNPLKIKSWLDVLPVDGIEVNEMHYKTLKEVFQQENLVWILTHNEASNSNWSHSSFFSNAQNHITLIDEPNDTNAKWVLEVQPAAISINCNVEQELGRKDFELFNEFFETLEIL